MGKGKIHLDNGGGAAAGSTSSEATAEIPELARAQSGWMRWMWIGCILFVVAASLHSADQPVGGGDTWVAMACGRFQVGSWAMEHPHRTWQMKVLDKFGVHITFQDFMGARTRPYNPKSRTLAGYWKRTMAALGIRELEDASYDDVGWVNQNWLTHTLFYKMKSYGAADPMAQNNRGEYLIVYYKFIQAILTGLFAYWAARVLGAHPLLAAGAAAFGVLLSRSYIDLRPNMSSIFFASIMILLLAYWRKGRVWALAGMIPLMIVWSNVHGGFIYAIMIFVIALGGYLVQQYLGKASYPLVLLGLSIGFILLVIGIVNMPGQIAEAKRLFSGKQILPIRYDDLRPAQVILMVVAILAALGTFGILLLGLFRFNRIEKDHFVRPGNRGMKLLLGAMALVVLIPAVLSPFGLENLLHPLIIATGKDGRAWRIVEEWRPIYEKGFGNVFSYSIFLLVLTLVYIGWWLMYFSKPCAPEPVFKRRSRRKVQGKFKREFAWPKIDLAAWGIIGITLAMSVKSRRFVYLGGVVLAPFLAQLAQEVVDMFRLKRADRSNRPMKLAPMKQSFSLMGAVGALFAAIIMTGVFVGYFAKEYFPKDEAVKTKRLKEEGEPSIFRHMVGIPAQPLWAMEFFRRVKPKGIVFNEWNHGGFVAFHQEPDPETGEPPCKLLMDGRAQAAYRLDHFQWWRTLRFAIGNANPNSTQPYLSAEGSARILQDNQVNVVLMDHTKAVSPATKDKLEETNQWQHVNYPQPYNQKAYRFLYFLRMDDPRNRETIREISRLIFAGQPAPEAIKK